MPDQLPPARRTPGGPSLPARLPHPAPGAASERPRGPDRTDRANEPDRPDRPEHPGHPAVTAAAAADLAVLDAAVTGCRACPRLVAWREEAARTKRKSYLDWDYWARPIPGFGPPDAPLVLVGLAPAAHGANRTGRIFTGDPSGDLLYAELHRLGLASRPESVRRGDGLELHGVRITDPVRCAPPDNRPTPAERDTCRPWIARELALLRPDVRAVVALGGFAWQALLPALAEAGWQLPRPRPVFGHGARVSLPATDGGPPLELHGCYHVSPRNTFTGRLTPAMLCDVLRTAARGAGLDPHPEPQP
ncbi:uracil-DNA glycosylase [Kitasatospora indigofera]|uniref:Type-5 uracil-DNA glycosylase n=1 Tax=Kitasatospora indigofera TaxID=67307 RepID=A0A919KMX6_9ACTN|nr:uracil-DNA glycosylase [Kitasatospora indigofera]GHH66231.1 uracil-DNA glycosylase [Kitasatospora indigofera]